MKQSAKFATLLGTTFIFAACANTPMGPTVSVMPQRGKPFEVFAQEKSMCEQYAESQVQGQADRANSTGVLEGVGGTILGAGLGAALGGGHGAAVGAGLGAVGGTAVGASTSGREQYGIQQQYNNSYAECMTSKGNSVQAPPPRPARTVIYQAPPPTVIYEPAPPPTVVYTQPAPPPY